MRKSFMLAIGAGALTLGLAPGALAADATPDVAACSTAIIGNSDAGEGMFGAYADDELGTFDVCSWNATGAAVEGAVASLNAWQLVGATSGNVYAEQDNVLDSGEAPTVQVAFTPAAEKVVLRVTAACDDTNSGCGANAQFAIGAAG